MGGEQLGGREGGAGLWRASFLPLPYALSFLLFYSREGVGGSSGSNRRRLVKGSCQNLPPTPASSFSSFQFNDQTSAWKKGEGEGGTESSPRRCCCVCMSERVQADTPPRSGRSLPSRLTEPQHPGGEGGERRRRRQQPRVPVQRTVTLPYSLRGGGGGRALCTFLSRAFPHFNRPGPIASRREQREGGREAHPGRIRKPPGEAEPCGSR